MAVFAYKGVDAGGKNVKGIRDAESAKAGNGGEDWLSLPKSYSWRLGG